MSDDLDCSKTLQCEIFNNNSTHSFEISQDKLVPALVVQSHPDLERIGEIYWMDSLFEGSALLLGRNHPYFSRPHNGSEKPLSDPYLSRNPIKIALLQNGEIQFDCKSTNIRVIANKKLISGAKKFTTEEITAGVVIELNGRITLFLKPLIQRRILSKDNHGMIGFSPRLELIREQVDRLGRKDESILIRGATGSGKELVAEAIYKVSNRAGKPFIKVNMGAMPTSLAAAELFGTQKGAFTGADKTRDGYFATANEGVLFLDEIGEASIEIQSMLLRVLETGEFYPVGSDIPKKVDVRIIASTDAHLEKMSQEKSFKMPLFHRLASYEINLPSLLDRKEDIGVLFLHFIKDQLAELVQNDKEINSKNKIALIPTCLMRILLDYHWPGNVRQLRNITRQLLIDSQGKDQLTLSEQIIAQLTTKTALAAAPDPFIRSDSPNTNMKPKRRKPNTVTLEELLQELSANLWEVQATADKLNISRTSIYELMKRFKIKNASDFTATEIEQCYIRCEKDLNQMIRELKISKYALTRRLREMGLVTYD